ncbi:unnamed protein product, partial [Mesorhabditis belari]|uniref:Alpha-1,6-mannosyl-glycoprotein 2-beta-N-acetylglucosaminyltransferase n=1 Tax=Mesorhabditis belari TaxID=2138241 RepID=A0AAF3FNZ8_9BILA
MLHKRRVARLLNLVIAASFLGIFYIFLKKPSTDVDSATKWSQPQVDPTLFRIAQEPVKAIKNFKNNSVKDQIDNDLNSRISFQETNGVESLSAWKLHDIASKANISGREIVNSVDFLNENFPILNDKFGPLEAVQSIIVIQVHNRLAYLKILIDTLRKATGIEKTLIIFSHDLAVPEINEAIKSIDFARVLQIFYPYNTQLFPHVFPGQHPADCPEKIKKDGAREKGCRNWETPDKYGNYRVAKLTQIKHHWWWKMNYVFDRVVVPHKLTDKWVVLLEEDHYVTPDFLHVLEYMSGQKENLCPQCDILCLGIYVKNYKSTILQPDLLGVAPWYSSKYNMGMTIQKKLWDVMKNCSEIFCTWDDYNWDWSMLQISVQCLPTRWRVLYTKAPRVLHIGDCGVHTHRCNSKNGAQIADDYVAKHSKDFFPSTMRVNDVSRRMLKPSKANGGWGDRRDHDLCRRNTFPLQRSTKFDHVLHELYNSTIQTA